MAAADAPAPQRLTGVVQSYEWGIRSPSCTVAALGAANTGAPAQPGVPYAELWLGTHPSGPARLAGALQQPACASVCQGRLD